MLKIIGTILRVLPIIWIFFGIIRIISGTTGGSPRSDIFVGIVGIIVAIITFRIGTWLKNQKPELKLAQRVHHAENAWWQADYRLRLTIFVSFIWGIGSYLLQDEYDKDLKIILLPSIAIIIAYIIHQKLILGPNTNQPPTEPPSQNEPLLSHLSKKEPDFVDNLRLIGYSVEQSGEKWKITSPNNSIQYFYSIDEFKSQATFLLNQKFP